MTQTQSKHQQREAKNPSPAQTPDWLYNEIMRFINPDLMTDHLPLLHLKYSGESDFERQCRLQSYEAAFAAFDEQAKIATAPILEAGHKEMVRHRRELQTKEKEEAAHDLSVLENNFPIAD